MMRQIPNVPDCRSRNGSSKRDLAEHKTDKFLFSKRSECNEHESEKEASRMEEMKKYEKLIFNRFHQRRL